MIKNYEVVSHIKIISPGSPDNEYINACGPLFSKEKDKKYVVCDGIFKTELKDTSYIVRFDNKLVTMMTKEEVDQFIIDQNLKEETI